MTMMAAIPAIFRGREVMDGQKLLKAVAMVSSARSPSSRKSDYERLGISSSG
jgi:hypothetical protein